MGEVIAFPGLTKADVPVENVLAGATEADIAEVVVIGFTRAGEFYFAASKADGSDVLWLLELAKKRLLEVGDG